MSNIKLTRVVRPMLSTRDGCTSIEQNVGAVCAVFEDNNGEQISVAFDGRFDSEPDGCGGVRETYRSYSDCAVIGHDKVQSGVVSDLVALRVMRDSLNAMDLGD